MNPYGHIVHWILSPTCLPIPPPERGNIMMSEKRDSNPRPPPWQGGALPTELFSHVKERAVGTSIAGANLIQFYKRQRKINRKTFRSFRK